MICIGSRSLGGWMCMSIDQQSWNNTRNMLHQVSELGCLPVQRMVTPCIVPGGVPMYACICMYIYMRWLLLFPGARVSISHSKYQCFRPVWFTRTGVGNDMNFVSIDLRETLYRKPYYSLEMVNESRRLIFHCHDAWEYWPEWNLDNIGSKNVVLIPTVDTNKWICHLNDTYAWVYVKIGSPIGRIIIM